MKTEKTILLMDDDPYACAVLENVVGQYGYRVECAPNSAEAIVRLKRRQYDGIILDAWLEHEQHESVLTWVRREQRSEPVIMMSDAPTDALWVEVLNKGAADLIAKPIQPAKMQRTLQMAFEKKCMTPPPLTPTQAVPSH